MHLVILPYYYYILPSFFHSTLLHLLPRLLTLVFLSSLKIKTSKYSIQLLLTSNLPSLVHYSCSLWGGIFILYLNAICLLPKHLISSLLIPFSLLPPQCPIHSIISSFIFLVNISYLLYTWYSFFCISPRISSFHHSLQFLLPFPNGSPPHASCAQTMTLLHSQCPFSFIPYFSLSCCLILVSLLTCLFPSSSPPCTLPYIFLYSLHH